MRRITLKREAALLGCFKKVNIYAEDAEKGTEQVGGVPCIKICTLKNGEERTLNLTDEAVRLFAVVEGGDKEICDSIYQLEEGSETVLVSGKCVSGEKGGSEFCFVGFEKHWTGKKAISKAKLALVISAVVIIIGALIGFSVYKIIRDNEKVMPKRFSTDKMNITLTDEFERKYFKDCYAGFGTSEVDVLVMKDDYETFPELKGLSIEEYFELVKISNQDTVAILREEDGLYYFIHRYTDSNIREKIVWYAFIYRTENEFWFIQFGTRAENEEKHKDDFFQWAKSVRFE